MQIASRKPTHAQRMQVALRCARVAGDILMSYYGKALSVETKTCSIDLVTEADKAADLAIREILGEAFPEDTLITEESFEEGSDIVLDRAWIVDPLDGTTNFAHSFPHFAVSIGFVEAGVPVLGVIFDPFKNELFTAIKGQGAEKNGQAIGVGARSHLGEALLATGFPYTIGDDDQGSVALHTTFLTQTHGIRRAGAAALDLAYVACGRLDGFWELNLAPWDVAAGVVLIVEAGGVVSKYDGAPVDLSLRKIRIVGANPVLHPPMVALTQEAERQALLKAV